MTTSSTYTTELANYDAVDEVFERIGIKPSTIDDEMLASFSRSALYLSSEWATKGIKQHKIETFTFTSSDTFTSGTASVTLNARVIRPILVIHRDGDGIDTRLAQISREEFYDLTDKTLTSMRPDRYFVDKQLAAPVLNLYPIPDNSAGSLIVQAFVMPQDMGKLGQTPDLPFVWWEAFVSGMAAKMAEKHKPERFTEKVALAAQAFDYAQMEDRDRSPVQFKPSRR